MAVVEPTREAFEPLEGLTREGEPSKGWRLL